MRGTHHVLQDVIEHIDCQNTVYDGIRIDSIGSDMAFLCDLTFQQLYLYGYIFNRNNVYGAGQGYRLFEFC